MITWYDPKEKLPESGDEVFILTFWSNTTYECFYSKIFFSKMKNSTCYRNNTGEFIPLDECRFDYWAYASEFNFPKDKQ